MVKRPCTKPHTYTLTSYQSLALPYLTPHMPPNSMSLRKMSSNDPSVSSPLSQVMSAADGEALPPPSNQPTTDIAIDDLSFDSVFESVEDYSPIMGPQLPTVPPGYQSEQYSYGSAAWPFTPPQTDYSASTPHQEPVVQLPQLVQNDHGDITAVKDAIMGTSFPYLALLLQDMLTASYQLSHLLYIPDVPADQHSSSPWVPLEVAAAHRSQHSLQSWRQPPGNIAC